MFSHQMNEQHKVQTSFSLLHSLSLSNSLISWAIRCVCVYCTRFECYRASYKQHSAMNNRMLLKAFKTISKVVLFHTKYLWCSCVSSSIATVLVFAAACSMFSVKWQRERTSAESTPRTGRETVRGREGESAREREKERESTSVSCMMKLKRSLFYPLPNIGSMMTWAMW